METSALRVSTLMLEIIIFYILPTSTTQRGLEHVVIEPKPVRDPSHSQGIGHLRRPTLLTKPKKRREAMT